MQPKIAASLFLLKIENEVFDVGKDLVPLGDGFDIHGAEVFMAFAAKLGDEVAADKAASPADQDSLVLEFHPRHLRLHIRQYSVDIAIRGIPSK